MSGLFKHVIGSFAKAYQANLAARIAPYGLKYEDLMIEYNTVQKALDRCDPEVVQERERRIKRAFDLSAKSKHIPSELQDVNGSLESYMGPQLEYAKREDLERKIYNNF